MERRTGTVAVLVLVGLTLLVLTAVGPAVAPPPIAMRTQGRAFGPFGQPLPSGTPIRTFVDGVDYSNRSQVQDAIGSFAVLTSGNSKTNANVSDTPTIQEVHQVVVHLVCGYVDAALSTVPSSAREAQLT